jgi:exosortase
MKHSEEPAANATARLGRELRDCWNRLPGKGLFFLLLVVWCFLFQFRGTTQFNFFPSPSLFLWMIGAWNSPAMDSSHGKLIPFVVLVLLWFKRERLARCNNVRAWAALPILFVALLLHVAGYLGQQPRLSMAGLFIGLYSLIGIIWGRDAMKATVFPMFLFVFCIPVGATLDAHTLGLRLFAARATAFVATHFLAIPLVREGTQLFGADGTAFEVAAVCSGIRSFVALLAITTISAVLLFRSAWKRAFVVSLTIPLAIFCNVIRLVAMIAAAHYIGRSAGEFVHEWFGYVTYAIAVAVLALVARWLQTKADTSPPDPVPPHGEAQVPMARIAHRTPWATGALAIAMIFAVAISLAQFGASFQLGKPGVKMIASSPPSNILPARLTVSLPEQVLGCPSTNVPVQRVELEGLPGDTSFGRRIYHLDDGLRVQLSVVLMGSDRASIHQPQYCLVAQNWAIDRTDQVEVPMDRPSPYELPVNKLVVSRLLKTKDGRIHKITGLYVYWFVSGEEITADPFSGMMFSLAKNLLERRTVERWAYVSCFTTCPPGAENIAFQHLQRFIRASVPEFQLVPHPSDFQLSASRLEPFK